MSVGSTPPLSPPSSRRAPARRIRATFERLLGSGTLTGVLLLAATAVALIWANSPAGPGYFALLDRQLPVGTLDLSLLGWLNDAVMSLFFLLVGLEIKRELIAGELASPRRAALPIAAALGGMIVPALLYWAVNPSGPARAGWGIPMATDIAFALGIMSLLGRRVPVGLKVFLTALAIVDDLGAVLVIALFYSGAADPAAVGVVAAIVGLLIVFNRLAVERAWLWLAAGVALWLAVHATGAHPTIAGVLLAMAIPATSRRREGPSLLHRLEHRLQPIVLYGIVPLFALANAGVRLVPESGAPLVSPVTAGVALGLVAGKPVGITLFSWLAVRLGIAALPAGATWRLLHGAAWLGGIGFTMSLFIAALAFGGGELVAAKVGVLAGSTVAGVVGVILLRLESRRVNSLQ